MHRRLLRYSVVGSMAAFGLTGSVPGVLGAQSAVLQAPPVITVSARGEVEVTPDRARIQVGVETQAMTAAGAADENNRKQSAVLAAIRKLGVPASRIRTLGYNVNPMQHYDDKTRRMVVDGYQVSNIVEVETDKLDQVSQIIDAGLSNGANRVAGLEFFVKDRTKAREEALAQAVASARRQAEVAAGAAGGRVAELLELSINEYDQVMPRPVMAMRSVAADAVSAPVSEGMSTVSVSVSTRWRFEK